LAFIGPKKRRKIEIERENQLDFPNIPYDKMILKDDTHTVYFRRLGYKNCPNLAVRSNGKKFNLKEGQVLEDMDRWEKIKELYFIIVKLDKSPRSKINIFNAMVSLIRHCDKKNLKNFYSEHAIKSFVSHLKNRYHDGIKGQTLMGIQTSIKIVLLEVEPSLLLNLRSDFLYIPRDTTPTLPYTDQEIKQIVQALYKIFNTYRKCITSDEIPKIHPLYNKDILSMNKNLNSFTEASWRKKLYSKNSYDSWRNELIKSAFFLTSFYTGANLTALINLRISDISKDEFSQISSRAYILKTVKNRQGGRKNFIEIGFSKKAKDFFETWLLLLKIITKKECDYVFPQLVKGQVRKPTSLTISASINNTFRLLGLPSLSTQRFRKTKATLIMRATESIFAVAEGLNNNPETVSKHYSDGVPETMEFSLAGALDIRQRTVQGESLNIAIIKSSYDFTDPVREKFYLKNKIKIPDTLSNGLRCKDTFGEKAQQLKNSLVKAGLAKEEDKVACHKFLECFGCPHHAVIAEVNDIWLMLSFRDVILEASCQPSINTIPASALTKVVHTVESILERLKAEFITEYKSAEVRYSIAPHPLWSNDSDLNLLSEMYQ
tara:strand:+ start:3757 stop:5568 length:1812 start_codon:yes stop_codon:yes gene_type:complete